MMEEWFVRAVLVAFATLTVILVVVLVRMRARTARELAQARAATSALRDSVDEIQRSLAARPPAPAPPADRAEHVITSVGDGSFDGDAGVSHGERIDGRLFADLVLRESLVKAASLAHGVRCALAPQTRNRIRFEMRREVSRSRKERRAQLKEARRDLRAQERARLDEDVVA